MLSIASNWSGHDKFNVLVSMDALRFTTFHPFVLGYYARFCCGGSYSPCGCRYYHYHCFCSCICACIFFSSKQSSLPHCRDFKTTKREGGINENPELRKVEFPSICPIWLEGYKEDDRLRVLLDCHHLFHEKCIDPWLELQPTCPVCRRLSPVPTTTTTLLAEVAPPLEV